MCIRDSDKVLSIVRESQQALELNKELKKNSLELSKAKEQLTEVNDQLMKMDVLKDEFLYTVTHELRTPLTSIRALSEIPVSYTHLDVYKRQASYPILPYNSKPFPHLFNSLATLDKVLAQIVGTTIHILLQVFFLFL